ncbi:MAG: hypothetical protein QM758_05955 [Armatimonas sp.]
MNRSEPLTQQELLNTLASAASTAQDHALDLARAIRTIPQNLNDPEAIKELLSQLESKAIDLQFRLQVMEDTAIKLGARSAA